MIRGDSLKPESLNTYFDQGVKKVIVAAPTEGALNIVLSGKLNGHAVRIPLLNASLTDFVFEAVRSVTAEEVNGYFKEAAEGELKGILGYEERPLVSADYLNDPRSSIVDALSTMVIDGVQVKVYAWYDNEWGYVNRMMDIAVMIARSLVGPWS
jgi:glyceraldehyde 3-phosphate dehydrogenase